MPNSTDEPQELHDVLSEEQIQALEEMNVLKDTAVRNMRMRQVYQMLRKREMRYDDAIQALMSHYHLSRSQVEKIIYRKTSGGGRTTP